MMIIVVTMLYCLTVQKTVMFMASAGNPQIWHCTLLFSLFELQNWLICNYKCVETCLAFVVCACVAWDSHCPQQLPLHSLTLSLVCALFSRVINESKQGLPGGICHMSGEHSLG
jgi:hypothetical protein